MKSFLLSIVMFFVLCASAMACNFKYAVGNLVELKSGARVYVVTRVAGDTAKYGVAVCPKGPLVAVIAEAAVKNKVR